MFISCTIKVVGFVAFESWLLGEEKEEGRQGFGVWEWEECVDGRPVVADRHGNGSVCTSLDKDCLSFRVSWLLTQLAHCLLAEVEGGERAGGRVVVGIGSLQLMFATKEIESTSLTR